MCQAPNLQQIRLAYHPIASIEPKAFDHLPNLQELDLAGNVVIQPMTMLLTDTLSMTSSRNFSKLDMGEWENLEDFEPGFLKNIQPHAYIDFLDSNIGTISKEAFHDISFYLHQSHLKQLRDICDDETASSNDHFVAFELLKNAVIAAGGAREQTIDGKTNDDNTPNPFP